MKTTGHIKSDSPRAARWREVFGGESVPLRGPIPTPIILEGQVLREIGPGPHLAYFIALEELTAEQLARLVDHAAGQSKLPVAQVRAEIETVGFPVLEEDVSLQVEGPWFL